MTRKQIIANFIFGLTGEEQEKLTWTAGKSLESLTNDETMALLERVYETRAVQEREKKVPDDFKAMTAEIAKLSTEFKNIQVQNKDIQDRLLAHQLHAVSVTRLIHRSRYATPLMKL